MGQYLFEYQCHGTFTLLKMQGQPQSSGEPWDLKHAGDPRGGRGGGGGRRGGGGAGTGGGGRGTHLTTPTCKNKTLARTTLKCYQSAALNHSLKSKAAMSQSSWFVYQNSQKQVKSSGQSIKLLILFTFTFTFHLISEWKNPPTTDGFHERAVDGAGKGVSHKKIPQVLFACWWCWCF